MSRGKGDPFTIKRIMVPVSDDQIAAAVRYLEEHDRVASKRNVADLMGSWGWEGIELSANAVSRRSTVTRAHEAHCATNFRGPFPGPCNCHVEAEA